MGHCLTCLHPGRHCGTQVYPPGVPHSIRTEESFQKAFKEGQASNSVVHGMKGLSPLKSYVH